MNRKKHSKEEISTKLAQASEMARQGSVQSEIASTLGVSVMTLHRWRRPLAKSVAPSLAPDETALGQNHIEASGQRITDLQLENSRLRRLVTDLLLEKMKLAEDMQGHKAHSHSINMGR